MARYLHSMPIAVLAMSTCFALLIHRCVCVCVLFRVSVIERAIYGLPLHHEDSFSAVCHFLAGFIKQGLNDEEAERERMGPLVPAHEQAIKQCLQIYGQPICESVNHAQSAVAQSSFSHVLFLTISSVLPSLCSGIISGVAGGIPHHRVRLYRGIVESMLMFAGEATRPWFTQALQKSVHTRHARQGRHISDLFHTIVTCSLHFALFCVVRTSEYPILPILRRRSC